MLLSAIYYKYILQQPYYTNTESLTYSTPPTVFKLEQELSDLNNLFSEDGIIGSLNWTYQIDIRPEKTFVRIFGCLQDEYLDKWSFDYLKKEYSKYPNLYVGCYEDDQLIGIAYGFIKGKIIILQGMAVKHNIWRKGIGSRILNFFEKQAKQTGMKIISVGSAEGFVEIRAKGEDHHLFAKEKVKDYEDGLKKKEKLRNKYNPHEVIFIMNKEI